MNEVQHPAIPAEHPPLRRGLPLLGVLPQLRRDVLALFRAAQRDQGDFVRLSVPGKRPVFLLSRPEHIRHVLQENHANYRRTPFHDKLKPLLGEGLVTSEGDVWRRQRRLLQPAFQARRIRFFVSTMGAATDDLADRWRRLSTRPMVVDMAQEMSDLTLAILVRTMFSQSGHHAAIGPAMQVVQEHFTRRFWALTRLSEVLPTPANARFRRALATLEAEVGRILATRRDAGNGADDLLGMLLAARDAENGIGMDRRQIRDEVMTMFIAGHETSAAGLTWTWYLLSQHPDIADRVRAEAHSVLAGRAPEPADVERLRLTRQVVQESLRLYPPVSWFGRRAAGPDRIAGHAVPADALLLFSPFLVHRDSRYWSGPERFDPERFAAKSAERPTYAYFPFGGGPRTCIGNHFAMSEMMIAIAMLLPLFDCRLAMQPPIPMRALVTLRPAHGLPMRVERRS